MNDKPIPYATRLRNEGDTDRPASKYKLYSLEDLANALDDIRQQIVAEEESLVWRGPDEIHSAISASSGAPSWHFSKAGIEYHAENGRGIWDIYNMVAIQLGIHQGLMMQEPAIDHYVRLLDIALKVREE